MRRAILIFAKKSGACGACRPGFPRVLGANAAELPFLKDWHAVCYYLPRRRFFCTVQACDTEIQFQENAAGAYCSTDGTPRKFQGESTWFYLHQVIRFNPLFPLATLVALWPGLSREVCFDSCDISGLPSPCLFLRCPIRRHGKGTAPAVRGKLSLNVTVLNRPQRQNRRGSLIIKGGGSMKFRSNVKMVPIAAAMVAAFGVSSSAMATTWVPTQSHAADVSGAVAG